MTRKRKSPSVDQPLYKSTTWTNSWGVWISSTPWEYCTSITWSPAICTYLITWWSLQSPTAGYGINAIPSCCPPPPPPPPLKKKSPWNSAFSKAWLLKHCCQSRKLDACHAPWHQPQQRSSTWKLQWLMSVSMVVDICPNIHLIISAASSGTIKH